MVPANTLLPVFALLRILGAAFQNWGVHKLLSARLLLRLSECFLHESMQKTYIFCRIIFSCFDCDLIARHPYSLLSCPPIEVHRRRNTAFITVLVVETDDCTAVFLIGASNALHACNAYNLIGRCTAEGHSRLLGSMCAFIFPFLFVPFFQGRIVSAHHATDNSAMLP